MIQKESQIFERREWRKDSEKHSEGETMFDNESKTRFFSLVPFYKTESELWFKIFRLKSSDREWQWNRRREYIGSHIVFQYGRWQEVEKFRYYCLRQTQHCTVIIASHFISRSLPVSLSSFQTRSSSFILSLISCFHEETRTGTSCFMLLSSHCCSISHFFLKPFLLPILSLLFSSISISSFQFLFLLHALLSIRLIPWSLSFSSHQKRRIRSLTFFALIPNDTICANDETLLQAFWVNKWRKENREKK